MIISIVIIIFITLQKHIKETSEQSAAIRQENLQLNTKNKSMAQQLKLTEKTMALEKQLYASQLEQKELQLKKAQQESHSVLQAYEHVTQELKSALSKLTEYSGVCKTMTSTMEGYRADQNKVIFNVVINTIQYIKLAHDATTERDKAVERAKKADVNTMDLVNKVCVYVLSSAAVTSINHGC